MFRRISTNDANEVLVSAGTRTVHRVHVMNDQDAIVYLKLYDSAAAVDETATPKMTVLVPADGEKDLNLGDKGVTFKDGIAIRMVTEIADAGTTGPTAANQIIQIFYGS